MGIDARHSYEDKILPVEEAYKEYAGRLAVMGGIDVDFLCRKTRRKFESAPEISLMRLARSVTRWARVIRSRPMYPTRITSR